MALRNPGRTRDANARPIGKPSSRRCCYALTASPVVKTTSPMKRKPKISRQLQRVASECIAVRVRSINRVVTALYDEAMRPHGLRVSLGNILVAIADLGDARTAEVCRMLQIDKSRLSRDVELMKRNGWLEPEPPAGGRTQTIRALRRG